MALTDEQHAVRAGGIGGSEVAAVALGRTPFADRMTVWRSKIEGRRNDGNNATVAGNLFEEPVKQLYAHHTGRVIETVSTIVHPAHPLVIATPDGISHAMPPGDGSPPVVIELKCVFGTRRHWDEPNGIDDTDTIPEYYVPQVMWEMAVTGLRATHVVAYFGGFLPAIYVVPWDEEMFGNLVTVVERFWRDHVVTGVPPPIDGASSSDEWLRSRYSKNNGKMKEADDQALNLIEMLRDGRRGLAREQDRVNYAANKLKEWLGEHDGVVFDGGRIRWKKNKDSQVVNYKGLLKELRPDPELVAKYTKTRVGARPFCPEFDDEEEERIVETEG